MKLLLEAHDDVEGATEVGAFEVDLEPEGAYQLLGYAGVAKALEVEHPETFAYVEFWDHRGVYLRGYYDDGAFEPGEPDEGTIELRTYCDRVVVGADGDVYWTAFQRHTDARIVSNCLTEKELRDIAEGRGVCR